ncbi:MAG: hypothetical protein WCJ62_10820 [Flavobacterium sp.]
MLEENITDISKDEKLVKEEVNTELHKHLSTIFVVVGIISFTLGAIVNWYTIKRLTMGGKD